MRTMYPKKAGNGKGERKMIETQKGRERKGRAEDD